MFVFILPQKHYKGLEMTKAATSDTAGAAAVTATAVFNASVSGGCCNQNCSLCLGLFYSCFVCLGIVMAASWVTPLPVLLQMGLYTAPILYVGSHLSLKQNEVDAITGEKINKGEAMNRTDAMLFPVFGSIALFIL